MKPDPIRKGYHTINASLNVRGGAAAIEFYKKAFLAEEVYRMEAPDGSLMHAELQIGDSRLLLSEENESWGAFSPQALGGTPITLRLSVPDIDTFAERAVVAGLKTIRPIQDQFWGDRTGLFQDHFGYRWSIATQIEEVSPAEMRKRAEAWSKKNS
jgi:PhnB protein